MTADNYKDTNAIADIIERQGLKRVLDLCTTYCETHSVLAAQRDDASTSRLWEARAKRIAYAAAMLDKT